MFVISQILEGASQSGKAAKKCALRIQIPCFLSWVSWLELRFLTYFKNMAL